MGKFVEKLQQVTQGNGGSVGFVGLARAQGQTRAPRPAALLVSLDMADAASAEAAAKQGADAIIVGGWRPGANAGKLTAALEPSGVLWGVEYALEGAYSEGALKQAKDAGASFAVLRSSSPAHALFEEVDALDLVMEVDLPQDDLGLVLLRAENFLPAQAALVRAQLSPSSLAKLTVADYARLRLACEVLRFPTLLTLAGAPDADHVRTLVRLGVSGLVLPGAGVGAEKLGAQVKALREQLEKTPARPDDRVPIAIGGLMESSGASLTPPQRTPRREPEPAPEPDEE